jgi:hypothetical protein
MTLTAGKEVKERPPIEVRLGEGEPLGSARRLWGLTERHFYNLAAWGTETLQLWTPPPEMQRERGLLEYGAVLVSRNSHKEFPLRFARLRPDRSLRLLKEEGLVGVSYLFGTERNGDLILLCLGQKVKELGATAGGLKPKFGQESVVFGWVRQEGGKEVVGPSGTVEEFLDLVVEVLEQRAGRPLIEASEGKFEEMADTYPTKAAELRAHEAARVTLTRTIPFLTAFFKAEEEDFVFLD